MVNKQEHYPADDTENNLQDPEPISFALGLFAALVGGAGLAVQLAQYAREVRQDRATVIRHLHTADRASIDSMRLIAA